ncbi:DNA-directed RNA polymerase I subunit rpa49 [Elasticomyces elasticus]|nr:DNA-directed RNA polymerase I subunit rpa49 [Elasticomyces elasticus]KAK4975972.1 DNA-directed RNA polymerase I subunit rpa49 [Elasticomyces elasticus]
MAEKDGKKRKRQSEGAEKAPNKKAAISVSYLDDIALHPLLVSTPGLTAPSIPFQAYTKPRSSRHTGKTPNPTTHDILLHSSAHQRVDYTAAPSTTDQYLAHYLAVFDPATNSLQITPAHHLNLRSIPRKQAPIDEEAQKQQRATYTAQREDLGKAFGTKKAQKFIASRTDNAIDKDPKGKGKKSDVQDAILESMSVASTPQQQKTGTSNQDDLLTSKPIPRPNLTAENVEDIYAFDTLIPPSEARLIQVRDWQTAARANEPVMLGHRFPVFRLGAAAKSDEITKLKALRYIALLLAFHDSLTGGGRNGKKVPKKEALLKSLHPPGKPELWSEALIDSVRIRFASSASNHTEVPKWELEKLYTHICALTLYVDDWRTDTTAIREDLKMDAKQLGLYFAELGAKIVPPTERERADLGISKAQAGAMKFARLKLPLEFPKAGVGRRR